MLPEFTESNLNRWLQRRTQHAEWRKNVSPELARKFDEVESIQVNLNQAIGELSIFVREHRQAYVDSMQTQLGDLVIKVGSANQSFTATACYFAELVLQDEISRIESKFDKKMQIFARELDKAMSKNTAQQKQGARPLEELRAELRTMEADLKAQVDQLKDGLQQDNQDGQHSQDSDQNGG